MRAASVRWKFPDLVLAESLIDDMFDETVQETAQLLPFCIDDEHRAYHDTRAKGYFSLLVQHADRKRQSSYALEHMPTVLSLVDPTKDSWLTQAEFTRPNRRVVNLARIGLIFADLDTYREDWALGRSPEALADAVIHYCDEEGIPRPSLMVSSGRGIQAKWLLTHVLPRGALPRWNAVQRHLVDRLRFLGADPLAKDASRVLRLVNTVNSKSGSICRVVHVECGPDGEPMRYPFDSLAEYLLPVDRAAIVTARAARNLREKPDLKVIDGANKSGLKHFSGRQLAWDRLEDLRRIAAMRGHENGLVAEGQRMLHLFWRMNFLLLSGATHSSYMMREAAELAVQLDPTWRARTNELSTLFQKAQAYERGEKIEFGGKTHLPLYTPKNETLISMFKITDTEMQDLRTIISASEARKRKHDRNMAANRNAGMISRNQYRSKAESRRFEARKLSEAGMDIDTIAQTIGISSRSVYLYLSN